ncbi:hypothetical protein HPB47_012305 [Ixodes persulcatus]|uniref:Uncharacterized protein n=1 Tax=Ixodes persulcatus TaxID=34615 RepID=A0AC60NTV8_IXOPE|nr:hypothetical protein HPB47_012305 [Ixodes persulcatus]
MEADRLAASAMGDDACPTSSVAAFSDARVLIRLPHCRWIGAASWRFRCCVTNQVPDSSTSSAGTCGRLSEDDWRPHRCFEQMLASEKEAVRLPSTRRNSARRSCTCCRWSYVSVRLPISRRRPRFSMSSRVTSWFELELLQLDKLIKLQQLLVLGA